MHTSASTPGFLPRACRLIWTSSQSQHTKIHIVASTACTRHIAHALPCIHDCSRNETDRPLQEESRFSLHPFMAESFEKETQAIQSR
jgi:hypothetical protein